MSMPPPAPRVNQESSQLPLPLELPAPTPAPPAPPILRPAQLWPSLPPDRQHQIRQAILWIVQEVARDAAGH